MIDVDIELKESTIKEIEQIIKDSGSNKTVAEFLSIAVDFGIREINERSIEKLADDFFKFMEQDAKDFPEDHM